MTSPPCSRTSFTGFTRPTTHSAHASPVGPVDRVTSHGGCSISAGLPVCRRPYPDHRIEPCTTGDRPVTVQDALCHAGYPSGWSPHRRSSPGAPRHDQLPRSSRTTPNRRKPLRLSAHQLDPPRAGRHPPRAAIRPRVDPGWVEFPRRTLSMANWRWAQPRAPAGPVLSVTDSNLLRVH